MPTPHFDKAVACLDQPWMFGPNPGTTYQQRLRTAMFAAANAAEIDDALSLGTYINHSDSNQQKRAARRAVMAAHFLIGNVPTSGRDVLNRRLKQLDLASLKRSFANRFAALQDNGNRPLWNPAHFTDPGTLPTFTTPRAQGEVRATPNFQFIIHGVGNYKGDVFDDPNILSRYEVLSMTLMSQNMTHSHDPQGIILRVPANNILAASTTDVGVLNYAPGFDPTAPNALTITENLMDVAMRSGGLRSPAHLNANARGYPYYNEVVVCGRSGVPLPHGLTGQMVPVGVYLLTDMDGDIRGNQATQMERELRVRTCARNHGLPMLYIPNIAAQAHT